MPDDEVWPCSWLVEVDSGNPDPDGPDDAYRIVECGAPCRPKGAGWACEAGHEHAGIEAELEPFGLEWQREQLERSGG